MQESKCIVRKIKTINCTAYTQKNVYQNTLTSKINTKI